MNNSQTQELEYVYAEIKHHLDNVLADETISTIIHMLKDYPRLKKFIDEYNKPYELRVTYQVLEQQAKEVKEQVEWKIRQLNYIEKNEDYEILDNETNLKVHYHRKGFIEGLEWYLKTLDNTVNSGSKT